MLQFSCCTQSIDFCQKMHIFCQFVMKWKKKSFSYLTIKLQQKLVTLVISIASCPSLLTQCGNSKIFQYLIFAVKIHIYLERQKWQIWNFCVFVMFFIFAKIDFTENLSGRKSWNFHIVYSQLGCTGLYTYTCN